MQRNGLGGYCCLSLGEEGADLTVTLHQECTELPGGGRTVDIPAGNCRVDSGPDGIDAPHAVLCIPMCAVQYGGEFVVGGCEFAVPGGKCGAHDTQCVAGFTAAAPHGW